MNRPIYLRKQSDHAETPFPPAVASLDATDRAILAALADDARIATSELARQIGLSAPATADRVRRLEAQGVIAAFTVELDPRAATRCRRSSA